MMKSMQRRSDAQRQGPFFRHMQGKHFMQPIIAVQELAICTERNTHSYFAYQQVLWGES